MKALHLQSSLKPAGQHIPSLEGLAGLRALKEAWVPGATAHAPLDAPVPTEWQAGCRGTKARHVSLGEGEGMCVHMCRPDRVARTFWYCSWLLLPAPPLHRTPGPPRCPHFHRQLSGRKQSQLRGVGKSHKTKGRGTHPHPENVPQDAQTNEFLWVRTNQGKWLHCSRGLRAETSGLKASRGMKGTNGKWRAQVETGRVTAAKHRKCWNIGLGRPAEVEPETR